MSDIIFIYTYVYIYLTILLARTGLPFVFIVVLWVGFVLIMTLIITYYVIRNSTTKRDVENEYKGLTVDGGKIVLIVIITLAVLRFVGSWFIIYFETIYQFRNQDPSFTVILVLPILILMAVTYILRSRKKSLKKEN